MNEGCVFRCRQMLNKVLIFCSGLFMAAVNVNDDVDLLMLKNCQSHRDVYHVENSIFACVMLADLFSMAKCAIASLTLFNSCFSIGKLSSNPLILMYKTSSLDHLIHLTMARRTVWLFTPCQSVPLF